VAERERTSHTAVDRKARSYIDKVTDHQPLHHTARITTYTFTSSPKNKPRSLQSNSRANNTANMTSTIGIPIKLLNESTVSHLATRLTGLLCAYKTCRS
jgi:hypothetical protein